jgi:hypothetical protein
VHGLLDADVDGRLAGEALPALDLEVRGEDDAIGGGDDGRVERRGAGRTLRLDIHLVAGGLAGLLKGLSGHVCVRDAGWA